MESERQSIGEPKTLEEMTKLKSKITQLLQKINEAYQQTRTIDDKIVSAYRELLEEEKKCNRFSQEEGIEFSSNVAGVISHDLMDTRKAIQKTRATLQKVQLSEDVKQEQIAELEKQLELVFERLGASDKKASELSDVVRVYKTQSSDIIKRQLYEEAFEIMNIFRICKLKDERLDIESEPVGIIDTILGKRKLKQMRLDNIDLQLDLVKGAKPKPKKTYSIRGILSDIYAFKVTEMKGYPTPTLNNFFESLRNDFGINGEKFPIDYIKKLAKPQIEEYEKRNLPAVPNKKIRLFGGSREQIQSLEEENDKLRREIEYNKVHRSNIYQEKEIESINTFKERLMDIYRSFTEEQYKTQEREDKKKTLDLPE